MSIRPLSFQSLRPMSIADRECSADEADFATLCPANSQFSDFLSSLPGLGLAKELIDLRDAIVHALNHKRSIIVGCGGHVIASGLGPLLVRAMEQQRITAIALTGDALLQDVEIALSGHTILRQGGRDAGVFGVSAEAGQLINHAIHVGARENQGIGEASATALLDSEAEYAQFSIVAAAGRLGIPITIHPAIGMDAFAIHPKSNGESLGSTGMRDFQTLSAIIARSDPGVILNVSSSMVLPRVMVQAVDVAKAVVRPLKDVTVAMVSTRADAQAIQEILSRMTSEGGRSIVLPGAEELLLPLLFTAVQDVLGDHHP